MDDVHQRPEGLPDDIARCVFQDGHGDVWVGTTGMYQNAFILIGVVCEEEKRISRLHNKYGDAGRDNAFSFMEHDANAKEQFGQHVGDAFHLSDFFVDNTVEHYTKEGLTVEPSDAWNATVSIHRTKFQFFSERPIGLTAPRLPREGCIGR